MKEVLSLLAFLLCWTATSRSEILRLKNGDQLTSNWQRVVDRKLVFKTDTMGEVTIPVDKVKSFTSQKPAAVLVKSGDALGGELSLPESGEWELTTNGGSRRIAPDRVVAIYPQELYLPKGQESRVMPWHNWKGRGSFGLGQRICARGLLRGGDLPARGGVLAGQVLSKSKENGKAAIVALSSTRRRIVQKIS